MDKCKHRVGLFFYINNKNSLAILNGTSSVIWHKPLITKPIQHKDSVPYLKWLIIIRDGLWLQVGLQLPVQHISHKLLKRVHPENSTINLKRGSVPSGIFFHKLKDSTLISTYCFWGCSDLFFYAAPFILHSPIVLSEGRGPQFPDRFKVFYTTIDTNRTTLESPQHMQQLETERMPHDYGIKEQQLCTCAKVFLMMWLDIWICCLLPWLHIIVLSMETTPVFCCFLSVDTPLVLLLASFSMFLNDQNTFSIPFSRPIKGLYHFKVFFNIFTILYEPCEMQSSITHIFF